MKGENSASAVGVGYGEEDISHLAAITRDKETKSATLEIKVQSEWALYSGPSVPLIDLSVPLLKGEGEGFHDLPVSGRERSAFQLVTPGGRAVFAEKRLPMAGGYNFRDMGGVKTTEGRYVKWGTLFRADDLHHLTETDLGYLASIPVISVVDFRSEHEAGAAPDKLPPSVQYYYPYSIDPGNIGATAGEIPNGYADMNHIMQHVYISLVSEERNVHRYKDLFKLLQGEENLPLLFHCSAGKDRTGMAAALIYHALGVDRETIEQDYLLTNTYLGDKYGAFITQYPEMKILFEASLSFLRAGMHEIEKKHGGVEKYLTEVLEVDIRGLRERFTVGAE